MYIGSVDINKLTIGDHVYFFEPNSVQEIAKGLPPFEIGQQVVKYGEVLGINVETRCIRITDGQNDIFGRDKMHPEYCVYFKESHAMVSAIAFVSDLRENAKEKIKEAEAILTQTQDALEHIMRNIHINHERQSARQQILIDRDFSK